MFLAALAPLVFFLLTFLALEAWRARGGPYWDWRESLLAAALAFGVTLTAITEVLSLFWRFTFGWIAGAWLLACLIPSGALFFSRRPARQLASAGDSGVQGAPLRPGRHVKSKRPAASLRPLALPPGNSRSEINPSAASAPARPALQGFEGVCFAITGAIVAAIAVTTLVGAPNNHDGMTYHLARVVHWAQNGSVAHYPTNIIRQLYLSPGAEFALAHCYILTGTDRLVGLVQWCAMVASLIGVSLIAGQFGGPRRNQILAAGIAATLPMGICQGSTIQNDYVLTFWLVCLAWNVTRVTIQRQCDWVSALGFGASLGLAILTKGTAYVLAFPFGVVLLFYWARRLKQAGLAPHAGRLMAAAALALALNLGFYWRNHSLFSAPVYSPPQDVYTNERFSFGVLVSNLMRNVAVQLGTPSKTINAAIVGAVVSCHHALGLDPNDPQTSWYGFPFAVVGTTTEHPEDFASNPLHFLLIVASLCVACCRPRKLSFAAWACAACALAAFILFCLALKWQVWHSRFHLPLLVVWCPFVAAVLEPYRRTAPPVLALLLLCSLPVIVANGAKPWFGAASIFRVDRLDQLCVFWPPDAISSLRKGAGFIRENRLQNVGFLWEHDDPEYCIWAALRMDGGPMPRLEHVQVRNISSTLYKRPPFNTFKPEMVMQL